MEHWPLNAHLTLSVLSFLPYHNHVKFALAIENMSSDVLHALKKERTLAMSGFAAFTRLLCEVKARKAVAAFHNGINGIPDDERTVADPLRWDVLIRSIVGPNLCAKRFYTVIKEGDDDVYIADLEQQYGTPVDWPPCTTIGTEDAAALRVRVTKLMNIIDEEPQTFMDFLRSQASARDVVEMLESAKDTDAYHDHVDLSLCTATMLRVIYCAAFSVFSYAAYEDTMLPNT